MKKIKQIELANKLGITAIYLNSILRKRKKPSALLALRIERASGGYIKAIDLRPEIFGWFNLNKKGRGS